MVERVAPTLRVLERETLGAKHEHNVGFNFANMPIRSAGGYHPNYILSIFIHALTFCKAVKCTVFLTRSRTGPTVFPIHDRCATTSAVSEAPLLALASSSPTISRMYFLGMSYWRKPSSHLQYFGTKQNVGCVFREQMPRFRRSLQGCFLEVDKSTSPTTLALAGKRPCRSRNPVDGVSALAETNGSCALAQRK